MDKSKLRKMNLIVGKDSNIEAPFKFNNTRKGFNWLVGKLQRIKQKAGAFRIVIGIEPSGHY